MILDEAHLLETELVGFTGISISKRRWINEKRKISGQWYIWQTALRLIQGYGRSIRSKEDWATTYVLDSAFGDFVEKNKNILPNWFIQAIQARIKIIS